MCLVVGCATLTQHLTWTRNVMERSLAAAPVHFGDAYEQIATFDHVHAPAREGWADYSVLVDASLMCWPTGDEASAPAFVGGPH